MQTIRSAVEFFRAWSTDDVAKKEVQQVLAVAGHVLGFKDGFSGRPCEPHGLTVVVPGIGSTLFSVAYREGYLAGQEVRRQVA